MLVCDWLLPRAGWKISWRGWSVTEPRPRLAHIRVPGHPEMARDGVVVTLGWLAHAGSTILRLKSRCLGRGVGTQTLGNGDR